MKDFLKFLTTRIFWKNFGIASGILVFLVLFFFVGLRIYTRHGQAISVPDMSGLTIEEVEQVTEARGLRFEVTDSVYYSEDRRGTIIDQSPPPNFKVKQNRTIFLTINAMNPEKVRMPNVVGISLRQAQAILETQGLQVGKLEYVPDIAVNNVLEQMHNDSEIEPGDMLVRGSTIDLVLGGGLSEQSTPVPKLVSLKYEDAINRIIGSSLNIGATVFDTTVTNAEDSMEAFVWRQRPEYDEDEMVSIRLGSSVDLWLTLDSTRLPQPDTLDFLPDSLWLEIPELRDIDIEKLLREEY